MNATTDKIDAELEELRKDKPFVKVNITDDQGTLLKTLKVFFDKETSPEATADDVTDAIGQLWDYIDA